MSALNNMVVFASNHITAISVVSFIIALINNKFRQLLFYASGRVLYIFIRKTYLHKSLGDALIVKLTNSGYKNKRFAGELFGEDPAYIRSEKAVKHILYRDFGTNTQLFYGKKWFNWVLIAGEPLEVAKDKIKSYTYVIYCFRWSVNLIKLLEDATETKNETGTDEDAIEENKFCVKRVSGGRFIKEASGKPGEDKHSRASEFELADPFSAIVPVKWEKDNIGELVYHNTLAMMSINPEIEDLLEEIEFWYNSQEWYEERGIPWKRGLLFYGAPGTGKTMLSRAIAEKLNMPLIIFDLASMDNAEFAAAWAQILPKRVVLFEDFDAVFHKRKNIAGSDLDFSMVLNILDGADKKQGILNIITTNHPETLDHALGGADEGEEIEYAPGKKAFKMPLRPGRVDNSVEFLPLNREGRMKVAMRIVKDETLAARLVDEGINDSAAQLQERCFRAAIAILFEKRHSNKKEPVAINPAVN